jgi:hypothetical protein
MATIGESAKYIRSKNAGPFWVTIDIFCETKEAYEKIKFSPNINVQAISRLYSVEEKSVKVFYVDSINVVKFSFPRHMPQGHKYENDMHYGQQYILLADAEV